MQIPETHRAERGDLAAHQARNAAVHFGFNQQEGCAAGVVPPARPLDRADVDVVPALLARQADTQLGRGGFSGRDVAVQRLPDAILDEKL